MAGPRRRRRASSVTASRGVTLLRSPLRAGSRAYGSGASRCAIGPDSSAPLTTNGLLCPLALSLSKGKREAAAINRHCGPFGCAQSLPRTPIRGQA